MKTYKVSFVDFGKQYKKYKPEIDEAMQRVLNNGKLILQEDVEQFEINLAKFIGTKYAVGVNSGTDALFLSLKLAGIGSGDEVITVGHTFHATVEAIVWNGARPILVDVGEDGMMDIDAVSRAITEKTKAIIPVHLMGDMVNMTSLAKLVRDIFDNEGRNIILIEDACQALGSEYNYFGVLPKKAGSLSLAGCFSFYPAKILGAYGDAGAVTTNDKALADEMKDMRNHYKYNPGKYGFNSRLDNLHAAVLNVKLKYLGDMIARRQEIADFYNASLYGVTLPTVREGRVYQDYIIRTSKRNELAAYLENEGIQTMKNDYHFPNDLPKPEKTVILESQTLRLPCNDILTNDEVNYVAEAVNSFYNVK